MNPFKCRHCDRPAHFYFLNDRILLCVGHGALHQLRDMLERSRLDKSVSVNTAGTGASASGERYSEGRLQQELPSPRLCRESGGVAPTAQMTQANGVKRAEVQGSATFVEESGRLSAEFNSPPSVLSPPEAGALADTPLPVTADAALSIDEYWSDFFDRRKATALRVMASKATQVPKSSSDIPNHHQ